MLHETWNPITPLNPILHKPHNSSSNFRSPSYAVLPTLLFRFWPTFHLSTLSLLSGGWSQSLGTLWAQLSWIPGTASREAPDRRMELDLQLASPWHHQAHGGLSMEQKVSISANLIKARPGTNCSEGSSAYTACTRGSSDIYCKPK